MILSIHSDSLNFSLYKRLIDGLFNIHVVEDNIVVCCHNVLPEHLKERGSEIINVRDRWYNKSLMNYLRAKYNVDKDTIDKYIMDNFNSPKVQELLNDVSVIGNQKH